MTYHKDKSNRKVVQNRHRRSLGAVFAGKTLWVVLVLGAMLANQEVVLLQPDRDVPLGERVL